LRYDEVNLISFEDLAMSDRDRRLFRILLAACAALALLILALMPAEKTLGQVIKIVYLHGALSRAGMLGFAAAGVFAGTYLIQPRPQFIRWAEALLISGLGFWIAHFLVSMPATRLTWGPWIAWGEPRVTMTLQIAAAGLIVLGVSALLKEPKFTATAIVLLAVTIAIMAARTGVLRHPLDPIGTSPSAALRFIYLLLLLPIVSGMFLIAWRLTARPLRMETA
jgi:heme exporter protein C